MSIVLYEVQDFLDNPELVNDRDACDSLLSQLMVALSAKGPDSNINQRNKILYNFLFLAHRHPTEVKMDAPMAVSMNEKGAHLYVNFKYLLPDNPYKPEGMTFEDYVTTLKHEALHLLWMHPIIYRNRMCSKNAELVSIGADTTVNQDEAITSHKEFLETMNVITLEATTEMLRLGGYTGPVKADQTSQYYIDLLTKYPPKGGGQGKGQNGQSQNGQGQDGNSQAGENEMNASHEQWTRGDASDEDIVQGMANQLKTAPLTEQEVKDILDEMEKGAGTEHTKALVQMLVELSQTGVIIKLPTFKSVMSKEMKLDPVQRRTIRATRPDNGTGVIKKGRKRRKAEAALLYFYGDTSGSIDFDDVENIIKTLEHQKDTYDARLYLFSDYVYDFNPKKVKVGGTDAQAIFDHLKNHEVNPHTRVVVLTDGYFSRPNTHGYDNVLWVLTDGYTTQHLPKDHQWIPIAGII
mgnify:CR=1 FL=1